MERSGAIQKDLERSGALWNDLEQSGAICNALERSGHKTFTDNIDFDMMFTDLLKTLNEFHEGQDVDTFAPTDSNLESVGFA